MIRGLGIDLAEIDRIRELWGKYGKRFAEKILTERELDQLPKKNPVPRLAALFAAKEAAVKALGTGFADGVHFKCIEVVHAQSGKPESSSLAEVVKYSTNSVPEILMFH